MNIYHFDTENMAPPPKWLGCVVAFAILTLCAIGFLAIALSAYMVYINIMQF